MIVSSYFRFRLVAAIVLVFFLWMMFVYSLSVSNRPPIKKSEEVDSYLPELNSNILIKNANKKIITLTIFYECLCPDSKSFVLNQLLPTVEKLEPYISVISIPYGKAKTITLRSGEFDFSCQHGVLECDGNKVHACVIAKVPETLLQVQIISCMIRDNYSPLEIGRSCCVSHNVDWEPIRKCSTGFEGSQLLKGHGEKTDAVRPKISFIPTITINDDQGKQPALLKNLRKEVCKYMESKMDALPEGCTK